MHPDRFCISFFVVHESCRLPIARACGSATPPSENRSLRDELLRIQAFTVYVRWACLVSDGQTARDLSVSPQRESCAAPSLTMSKGAFAERASQSTHRDELAHSQGVLVGDGVLPLTVDTSLPGSTGIPETLQTPFLTRYDEYSTSS